ncbi:MAG: FAD binding domain-containing protein [Gemmatimonadota bacterium]|nr:FAD binding domain-containing protein [Gemmatimonadota bacterium]MDE2870445.1 FAD binding domain-containing protein [Gemmatimonadota bacterium]
MNDFTYHAPTTLNEALAALGAEGAKVIAGGHSLLPVMKLNLAAPTDLVSLAGVPGLADIADGGDSVTVGAMCTHAQVAGSAIVQARIPALTAMADGIGDAQVRNAGTIGGSVAHNDPAADYPAACVALGATIVTDRREIHSDDFFQGMFMTPLEDDEVITAVRFPVPSRASYAKFANPASKYAIAGVMVAQGPAGVRVAVTGASGDGVFRVGEMEAALGESFSAEAVAGIAVSSDGMLSDTAAGAQYRAHLVAVMAKRAVAACG